LREKLVNTRLTDERHVKKSYLLASSAQQRSIGSDTDTCNGAVFLGLQLVNALALTQVPDANHATTITTDQFSLVGVDDDVIDGELVSVVALKAAAANVPDLDGAVLGASDHPFALTVECDSGDVSGMALKSHQWVRVARLGVKQLDIVMARNGEILLVGGDAESIDLRVRVLNGAGADARESFPEAVLIKRVLAAVTGDNSEAKGDAKRSSKPVKKLLTGWYGRTPLQIPRY
jgi:hypothetical protein